MRIPLTLGIVITLVAWSFLYQQLHREDAQRAKEMVAQKMGPKYRYFTNTVYTSYSGKETKVAATVQAWNDNEALQVPVQWIK